MGDPLKTDDSDFINPYYKTLRDDFILNDNFHFVKEQIDIFEKDPELFACDDNLGLLKRCHEFMDLYRYYLAKYRRWNEENGIDNVTGEFKQLR